MSNVERFLGAAASCIVIVAMSACGTERIGLGYDPGVCLGVVLIQVILAVRFIVYPRN